MLPSAPDRLKRLLTLFDESLELPPEARSAFLDERCAHDPELRQEVEDLLERADGSVDFLDQSVLEAVDDLVAGLDFHELAPGTIVDHYEIVSLLARGGMGQVYCAEDLKLKRQVAFKVLAPEMTQDSQGVLRFELEAQAASALNHPNIVTVYEFGQLDELHFIASELVDGVTLRQKLANGSLELDTTLDIAIQIAGALDVAHSSGIVHRDIKPENVMVRSDGLVKILDFGIAKLGRPGAAHKTGFEAISFTQPGMMLGTVAYMSPEQATGKELDGRTDLFSLGAILYEMTTGATPFPGENGAAVLEGILFRTPLAPGSVKPQLPAELDRIIKKALEKDRNVRYQQPAEIRSDLQELKRGVDSRASIDLAVRTAGGRKTRAWLGLGAFAILALLIGLFFPWRHSGKLTEKDSVVVAEFSNATHDPVFDGTLRQGLFAQLEQSPFLNLLSDSRVAETLSLMAKPQDTRLTADLAREVCQRTASAATIEGSISALGSQYVVGLKAVNCTSGDLLAQEQATANGKEEVLKALGEAATKLRSKLGESLASIQKYDAPPENVTTASLEALQAYSAGYRAVNVRDDYLAAFMLFQRAIDLDPNFAMAYARLGTSYSNQGEAALAAKNITKAYELRGRVSERERFYIDSHYEWLVLGNVEAALKIVELWSETYPRDPIPPGSLTVMYSNLGDYDKALAASQKALQLDPGNGLSYANLVSAYTNLNRLPEASQTAQQAQASHLDSPTMHLDLYTLDFLRHDTAEMEREVASHAGKLGSEDILLYFASDTAAYGGQFAKAREFTSRAVDSAQHLDEKETAASYLAESAVREALAGNAEVAKRQAQAALALSSGRDVEAMSAIALATAGDSDHAKRLATGLAKQFPQDTIVQYNYLPTIGAAAALQGHDPAKALELLAPAAPYELGSGFSGANFALYPVYFRGLANLLAHNSKAALSDFQKILDHAGVVVNEPIGALAHLGAGRGYALAGDGTKARAAYEEFLGLWKDADPDTPILKQAKGEYAKLQ